MSALGNRMASRRVAAEQADRRKKLILVGLVVVLVALLAFELPKLLKRSGSSSSTAPTSSTTPGTPASASDGTRSLTAASRSVSVKRIRVIHHLAPKDLFVPLIHDTSSSSSSASPSTTTSAPVPAAQPAAPAAPASTMPAVSAPAHAKPAVPTAALIWTNGRRQVVGLSQVFKVGDARFRLVAVTRTTIRIKVVGGAFAGRGQSITVLKGHRVKLANTATGVQYGLLFTQAGIAASSTRANSN
jgi:cytoskeletal protein RodZ